MNNKILSGIWGRELRSINKLQQQIRAYQEDISAHYQHNALIEFINNADIKLSNIETNAIKIGYRSFYISSTIHLLKNIEIVRNLLLVFKEKILFSERSAAGITQKYTRNINNLILSYAQMNFYEYLDTTQASSQKIIRTLGFKVWYSAQKKLDYFKQIQPLKRRKHNSLAQLLLTNNQDFIETLSADKISIEGEIGLLIVQRLQEIYYSPSSSKALKTIALKRIREILGTNTNDNLLFYNQDMLQQEITRLVLHAELHPHNKIVWLGTARAVNAAIQYVRPKCVYLNPPPRDLTWGLNRLWLQAAVELGYEFRLVEQHFPVIEKAILSQDPAKFLEQLLLETRGDSIEYTSQYNGQYSCTATTQEILALMNMGCVAYKDNKDHSIKFTPRLRAQEEPLSLYSYSAQLENLGQFQRPPVGRIHSSADIKPSNPPPYDEWTEHFVWNK